MDREIYDEQAMQERLRTRWTPALDKIFADVVVEQIQQGNMPNNVFDKKAWNQIREEFNRQTNLDFNNNQLRKHLDVLQTRYHNLQSNLNESDTTEDHCYMEFDLGEIIGVKSKIKPKKVKVCPISEQLSTIYADSSANGKYALSSHYGNLDKSKVDPLSTRSICSRPHRNNNADKKRKHRSNASSVPEQRSWSEELSNVMAGAILDMMNSSKLQSVTNPTIDEGFSISDCINTLDKIEGIDDCLYYAALDLFEDPSFREVFFSLKGTYVRLMWLQQKCGIYGQPRI